MSKELGLPPPGITVSRMVKEDRGNLPKPRYGRKGRRPEEDIPGKDYVARMTKLGPRPGESMLNFLVRLAGIKEARRVVLSSAQRNMGVITHVARELGVTAGNLRNHLKVIGLTPDDLKRFAQQ